MKDLVRRRFPALRSRDFRLLWVGQFVSQIGSQMQFWAINWHIYGLTHSPIALGLIGLVRVGPILVFSMIGGTVADAVDRRRLMLATQSLLMLVAAGLGTLTHYHRITVGAVYMLSALGAAAVAFDNPARQSLIPNLVPREHLTNAISLGSTVFQVATIIGPAVAGLMIAGGGIALTYWINAGSFLAVILALLLMRPTLEARESLPVDLKALREGLSFVRRTHLILSTMVLDFFATFFSSANALLPIFARDVLRVGAQGYGILAAAPAVGSLCAGVILSTRPSVRKQGRLLVTAVAFYGLCTVAFGLSRWFGLSLLCLAGAGASDTVSTVIRQSVRQLITPDRLRGRMTAVSMVFYMGGPQLGEFEAGVAAHWLGAPISVVLGGAGCLASVAVVALRDRRLLAYQGEVDAG